MSKWLLVESIIWKNLVSLVGLAKDDWWYDRWTSGSSKTWKTSTKEHWGFRFSEIKVYIFLNVYLLIIDTMGRWQNGGFSLVKISPVERGIQLLLLLFFFFSTRIPIDIDGALNFSFPCLTRYIGYKMFFHNKVVVPSGYGEKRSLSVFPFKCVYSRFGFP